MSPAPGHGLRPRPTVDPVVMAVIAAAYEQVMVADRVVVVEESDAAPPWRFSGRWWAKNVAVRRDRPWARR